MKTLLLAALLAAPARAEIAPQVIDRAKNCVVSVERHTLIGLNGESAGRAKATGFIVDLAAGIIATNRHVTGTSPSRYKVRLRSGSSETARLLYYDPFNDFAFLQVSTAALAGAAQAAFAGPGGIREGAPVFLVGNNEGYEYSVKTGVIANPRVHKGPRQTHTFQTSFDRTGGASGSPVFDGEGRVLGIHSRGSDTSSFELPSAYLEDALNALRAGRLPRRGDPLLTLSPVPVSEAVKAGRLPGEAAARAKQAGSGKRALKVETSLRLDLLKPGDILLAADGTAVGDDSYLFDKLMDDRAGGEAEIEFARNGKLLTARVPVADANAGKTGRFLSFCGAIFTPFNAGLRLAYGENSPGVLLDRAEKGSPFYQPSKKAGGQTLLVQELNGRPVADLAAFETAAGELKDGEDFTFSYTDLSSAGRAHRQKSAAADLKFWPTRAYEWSQAALDWIVK